MKKYLLSLFVSMLAVSGAWAQEIVSAATDDVEGAEVRRLEVVLSGDWLGGDNVEAMTTQLIDLIMGYRDGGFVDGAAFTEVTIKSAEGTTVTVSQSLVQQLVTGKAGFGEDFPNGYALEKSKITRLDLSDVAVTHYVGHDGAASPNSNATLYARNGGVCPIKYLAMPSFDTTVEGQTYSIPPYTTAWMNELLELDLPKNAKIVEQTAFASLDKLAYFHLNPGLEFIGNSAFWAPAAVPNAVAGVEGMEALDVPASVKYIGPGAFRFRNFTDLYFHSAQAPICPVGRSVLEGGDTEHPFILDGNYMGWGGQKTTEGDDYAHGYANRSNYKNGEYWFTMVHFPNSTDVPGLDVSSYKDDTRVYNKVYGTINTNPAWTGYAENYLEVANPGQEQDYIARGKNWYFADSRDFVGQETEVFNYGKLSTMLAEEDKDQIPEEYRGKGAVTSGYEDTYRGLNYIWPSQSQYYRAYITVAKGLNWDGVTPYRPDITTEQYLLMAKDGLEFKDASGNWVSIADMLYTPETAAAHNASLPNAIHEGEAYEYYTDQDEIDALNALLPLKGIGDDVYYTEAEVIEHNASLTCEGAVHEGDIKETVALTYEEWWAAYTNVTEWPDASKTKDWYDAAVATYFDDNPYNDAWMPYPCLVDVKYTKAEAALANANLPGAISTDMVNYTIETQEQADAYNESLPGFIHMNDVKSRYTAEEALAWNSNPEKNPGAVKVGDSVEGAADYSDDLSRIAFQSTRRCVFADNGAGGDEYNTHVPATAAWWTICLPFDLTRDQIDEFFGKGTHVCLFNQVDREIKSKPEKSLLKFYFTDDQYSKADKGNDVVLKAHVPYMIRPTLDGANGTEDEVIKIHMSNFYMKTGNPEGTDVTALDGTKYRFIGNYDTKLPVVAEDGSVTTTDVVVPQYSYIYAKKAGAKGKHPYQFWFTQNAGIKWAPNKCIIQSTDRDRGLTDQQTFFGMFDTDDYPEGQVKQMTILLGDDDANEIDVVFIAGDGEKSEVIYNLNGQMIRTAPQNGVYIKNGKKYIAR